MMCVLHPRMGRVAGINRDVLDRAGPALGINNVEKRVEKVWLGLG